MLLLPFVLQDYQNTFRRRVLAAHQKGTPTGMIEKDNRISKRNSALWENKWPKMYTTFADMLYGMEQTSATEKKGIVNV